MVQNKVRGLESCRLSAAACWWWLGSDGGTQGLTMIRNHCLVDFDDSAYILKITTEQGNKQISTELVSCWLQSVTTVKTLQSCGCRPETLMYIWVKLCLSGEFKSPWIQQGDSFVSVNPCHPHTHPDLAQGGQPAGTPSFNGSAPTKLHLPSVQTADKAI